VLSHTQPNATAINPAYGSITGTIDLGGAPEQAASDGQGHLYIALEDKDNIAVVDVKTMKVTAHYDLEGKGKGPAGLGLDAKNQVLFAFCHEPPVAVMLNAADGKILGTVPIGKGCDGGGFNPKTMEAFSSQSDGTLTIIKENSPTTFEVAQTVRTKSRAKTCTLDTQRDQIIVITTEALPKADNTPANAGEPPARRASANATNLLDIIVIGH